jgi:creatinine amidohydrolase
MKPHILGDATWKNIKDQEYRIALLPWGATEAHNMHLPYATDTILAAKVAEEAAKAANEAGASSVVLPPIAYGVNTGQMDVKLCMNMRPSTQMAILRDILEVLRKHSIKHLVILNAHGGNSFVPLIRELSLDFPEIIISSVNWWTVCKPEEYFREPGDHAGELETSCMLHVAPGLVLPLSEAGDGTEKKFKVRALREKWAWTPRRWIYISKDTGVGDPKFSNPDSGKRFLDCCIDRVAKYIIDLSDVNNEEDLYEK